MMTNYNIVLDLLKIRGAKVMDVKGRTETRRCVVLPIDNATGTVSDAYSREQDGERVEVRTKGVYLNLTAFELREKNRGQSHLVKPAFAREVFERMTDEQLRQVPFIGNMKPWTKDGEPSGSDW